VASKTKDAYSAAHIKSVSSVGVEGLARASLATPFPESINGFDIGIAALRVPLPISQEAIQKYYSFG